MNIPWTLSLLEQLVNTFLGLVIGALFLIYVINPLFSLTLTVSASLEVSMIMFLVSILRGFVIRRLWLMFQTKQSFKHSFIEKFIDVSIGLVVSTLVWTYFVMPAYEVYNTLMIDILINLLFFVVNLSRSLWVRRSFERYTQKCLTEKTACV